MTRRLAIATFAAAAACFAQLPAPNAAGVSAGHDIFSFHDLTAAENFFNALGGQPAELGPLKMTKFPGVLFLMRQGDPKGGTEGSTVGAFRFKVRDLKSAIKSWDAAGLLQMKVRLKPNEFFLSGPDGVMVQVNEDASLTTPIAADGIDMVVSDVDAAAAWYSKWFGAKIEKRGAETVGMIPGSNIFFTKAAGSVTGTKGRAFDRIGLEVKNVEQFCKNIEASGIKLDGAFRRATAMNLAVCVFTDPWGTYIEVSEGLAAVK